ISDPRPQVSTPNSHGVSHTILTKRGDYNVISRDHQPRYPGFRPFEYDFLDALALLGLCDVHRTLHPDVQTHSWIGRAGNGYRFDYLHAGPGLLSHLAAAAYLNQPRLEGLSDHLAHSVDIDAPAAGGRGAGTSNVVACLTSRTYS
ncbi:hypothetical protein ACLQ28_34465, partial [Micromonospora sp. DT201]|uniref:hypothetical protein n=1 Tax=Micromonospora sp. DT201 TaxID=3393442 RepID=UPI003CF08FF9